LSQPLAAGQSRPPSLLYLIDTSALARVRDEAVRNIVAGLLATRLAATAVTVDLEAGYSGRDLADVKAIAELRQSKYVVLPVTETIAQRAREVQVLMAARGHHRAAGAIDLLTAAIAEHHGAVIMHYDADFEHIAAVTGQLHRWILPRGSIP
jgi:predicted nucleic acid-binding protein